PETATVTYLPYLRFYNYFRKKLPFGVFQIGKAYRNEISPRQHVLRGREFTQAEGQLFIDPKEKNNWEQFENVKNDKLPLWDYKLQESEKSPVLVSLSDALKKKLLSTQAYAWCLWLAYSQFRNFGIPVERIRVRQHHPDERAFYAADAWDIEIKTNNFGWVEVCGVHDRTDYDLSQHSKESGVPMEATRESGEKFVPHILEIAFGTDRPTYALIDLFYEKKEEEEGKTLFKIPYHMAPIPVAVFPLMKKPELTTIAEKIRDMLLDSYTVNYDESGSIGKRYLRSMTAGTPFAITVDFDSLNDKAVTVRDRDSGKQERVKITALKEHLISNLNN
ncbi:MAG: glycine--tRNA ligase, partial [Nanoarchaeota archaeon]